MNHCKKTAGHKPSRGQRSKSGVLKCYTCNLEFRSYHDLMEHRKEEHPSHKTCRYFIKGECLFSAEECWYLHDDRSATNNYGPHKDEECYGCKTTFPTKFDLMEHKKTSHMCQTPCLKFQNGNCDRSAEKCSFKHVLSTTQSSSRSPQANVWAQSSSNVQNSGFYQPLPVTPPDQDALMIALNMLTQRLETLENRMFPKAN